MEITRKIIDDWVDENYYDEEILLMDGLDAAFLGVGSQWTNPPVAVYDRGKCIEILVERDGMSWHEAEEFFEFNCSFVWAGERTPLILDRPYHTVPRNRGNQPGG